MLKFYVNSNQLYNFLILKEPVQLIAHSIKEDDFELQFEDKDLIITTYRTYSTVELKTFKKKLKSLFSRK